MVNLIDEDHILLDKISLHYPVYRLMNHHSYRVMSALNASHQSPGTRIKHIYLCYVFCIQLNTPGLMSMQKLFLDY